MKSGCQERNDAALTCSGELTAPPIGKWGERPATACQIFAEAVPYYNTVDSRK